MDVIYIGNAIILIGLWYVNIVTTENSLQLFVKDEFTCVFLTSLFCRYTEKFLP